SFAYMLLGIVAGIVTTKHLPNYLDFFWTSDLFVISIVGSIVGWTLIFNHELAHFIVAKACGAESLVRYSNRYTVLVMVTEHFHLSVVDKPLRYLVYLSGMYMDILLIATVYWIFTVCNLVGIDLGIYELFLNSVILFLLAGVISEFNLYLETDVYNFFTDYLNQDNLYNDTKKYLSQRANKWKNPILLPLRNILKKVMFTQNRLVQANDLRIMSKGQKRVLHMFSLYYILGILMATAMLLVVTLPRDIKFITDSVRMLSEAIILHNWVDIAKSIIIVILALLPNVLLVDAIVKKHKKHGSFI
ncbi:hypothetical protein KAZ57_03370, partial [Patescibacteria group bacterium]|nr:hypothetical protein [Patescibacteria group bacterium]